MESPTVYPDRRASRLWCAVGAFANVLSSGRGAWVAGVLGVACSLAWTAGWAADPSSEVAATAPEAGAIPLITDPGSAAPSPPPIGTSPLTSEDEASLGRGEDASMSTPDYSEVENPAFPPPRVVGAAVELGRLYREEDVSPYFASGTLAQAKVEFDRGRFAKALGLLAREERATPPVRYLRALAALRAGDPKRAATDFEALTQDYPAMRDRALTHAAMAYEDLGQWGKAASLFAQVPESSRLYADARLGMFRMLRKQNDVARARAALESLATRPAPTWGRDVGAEALAALAELAAASKDRKAERAALVELWGSHPQSSQAVQAEKRLRGVTLPLEARVKRAEVLMSAELNRDALALLEPLLGTLPLPDPLACRAHYAVGRVLRKERQHTRAIAVLEPVAKRCTDPELLPRVLYTLGSSQSIVDMANGVLTYERLAREFPTHTFADDALFYAADLYTKQGQVEQALSTLLRLGERYPGGDFAGEALFKAAWLHRVRGEPDKSLALLARIREQYGDSDETLHEERARYWQARMYLDSQDTSRAVQHFESLALEHPATYYGWVARRRVAELAPERAGPLEERMRFPVRARSPWPLHAGTLGEDPRFKVAVELFRLGFPEAVPAELLSVSRLRQPPEAIRLVVHLLALAKDARSAHAVARLSLRRDLAGPPTEQTRSIWELAYPRAFRELVVKHTSSVGLEPDLLQALMREESALDPNARSWAGALGLTQLMPGTARQVARQLKLKAKIPHGLFEPELNIRLGGHYLGTLVKQWQGTYEYALASYNAGARSVAKWRAARPQVEIDEWVEEIPIEETRKYVKRVLCSYNTYRMLYPEGASSLRAEADVFSTPTWR